MSVSEGMFRLGFKPAILLGWRKRGFLRGRKQKPGKCVVRVRWEGGSLMASHDCNVSLSACDHGKCFREENGRKQRASHTEPPTGSPRRLNTLHAHSNHLPHEIALTHPTILLGPHPLTHTLNIHREVSCQDRGTKAVRHRRADLTRGGSQPTRCNRMVLRHYLRYL